MKRRILVVMAAAGLLAGLLVGVQAAPAQATPSGTNVCRDTGNVRSCLRINYGSYAPTGGYRVTRAAASLTLYVPCAFPPSKYSNLWKNISYLEERETSPVRCVQGVEQWHVEYWDTADGDPARIFPGGGRCTRFHSTWQGIDDSAFGHPIFWVPAPCSNF